MGNYMDKRYSEQKDDPRRQVVNNKKQTHQRDQYRHDIVEDPHRNTGLPGFDNPAVEKHKGLWKKNSQDAEMLRKDDQMLDDDNNIRKDADVNLDQRNR